VESECLCYSYSYKFKVITGQIYEIVSKKTNYSAISFAKVCKMPFAHFCKPFFLQETQFIAIFASSKIENIKLNRKSSNNK